METKTSHSLSFTRDESLNYDGISVQQSLLFSDSLKDLKNLRTQLYSAAEYFEYSYTNDDQKQIVVDTLKDYAVKALVNTVDHLGSATYKVNDLFDEKVDEVSCTELRVSCIEQRLRTCNDSIDHKGLSEHSIVINTPKYHKRYILPVGETMIGANHSNSKYQTSNLDEDGIQLSAGKECSPSVSPPPPLSQPSSIPEKELEKHTVSPCEFPILRTGSLSSRENAPNSSGPTTPRASFERRMFPLELRKSASMFVHQDGDMPKDTQRNTSKSKRLLKALLSKRKSKKDIMLYTYLDEY